MTNIIAVPFGYLMRFCYDITHNYALALILFTLFFKLILMPLSIKQHKSSVAQARIKPKERAIRKRYAGRKDQNAQIELQNEIMKLYREENVSMAGGCLPLLIQFPIIIALYKIIQQPLSYLCMLADNVGAIKNKIFELFTSGALNAENTGSKIYDIFTKAAGSADKFNLNEIQMVNVLKNNESLFSDFYATNGLDFTLPDFTVFGGAADLSQNPSLAAISILVIFPVLAALFQFLSTFIMQKFGPKLDTSTPEAAAAAKQMKMMNIIFPATTLFFGFSLPAILSLYWIYQSIISTAVQVVLYKMYPTPVYTEEDFKAIEEEMNRDYIPPEIPASEARRSLHNIDEDDDELEYEDKTDAESDEPEENEGNKKAVENTEDIPRRRYDKDGNKIRSLHYIDEDDEEENK